MGYREVKKIIFYSKCNLIKNWIKNNTGQRVSDFYFSKSSMSCYMYIGNVQYRLSDHGPHPSYVGISFYMVWNTDILDIIFGIIYETWKI